MHLFVNGLAASAGGGLTYLHNVIPELSKRPDVHTTVALSQHLHREFEMLPNVSCVAMNSGASSAVRFWREQTALVRLIKDSGGDVLISAGNFALRDSPVSQILLSGNSLYSSRDFTTDLRSRREYFMWLDTHAKGMLAKRSIAWADCTVAPSEAFAQQLRRWSGIKTKIQTIHHGFDQERFFQDQASLPVEIQRALDASNGALRLLFVSHYNYYRNFETLLRSIPLIQESVRARPVRLFLTCRLLAGANPGDYKPEFAAALIRELGIGDNVVQLGAVPHSLLHRLYRACHIYTTAAYTETFAHPLVEAMASGLPVVASDIPVHQEVCGEAALYFGRFSPEDLAAQTLRVVRSRDLETGLAARGRARSRDFSWVKHVDQLLALACSIAGRR